MTGEITLRGHVLPIGGLKEKLLAAQMEGMKLVLIPEKNRSALEEVSEEIKAGMEIRLVKEFAEVAEAVLCEKPETEAEESGAEQSAVLPEAAKAECAVTLENPEPHTSADGSDHDAEKAEAVDSE